MHEHVLFDFSPCAPRPTTDIELEHYHRPLAVEDRGRLRFDPLSNLDNLSNRDEELAAAELRLAVDAGSRTIVDATNQSLGRDPEGLRRLAEAAGVQLVMATGYYTDPTLPSNFERRPIEDIADELTGDLTDGVADTGVRAGVIGEIGTSSPITRRERRSLRAAARAQSRTGAPLMVHLDGWGRRGLTVLDIVEREGADPSRVVLCHMNPSWADANYQMELLARGAWLEFDMFGNDHVYGPPMRASPNEDVVIGAVANIIARGHIGQLLLSQDVYLKMMLRRFGGHGYAHLLTNLVALFHTHGIPQAQLDIMLTGNPARVLGIRP